MLLSHLVDVAGVLSARYGLDQNSIKIKTDGTGASWTQNMFSIFMWYVPLSGDLQRTLFIIHESLLALMSLGYFNEPCRGFEKAQLLLDDLGSWMDLTWVWRWQHASADSISPHPAQGLCYCKGDTLVEGNRAGIKARASPLDREPT